MRCAIDFDETKPLMEQNIRAWGEMQSTEEEPAYKEEDITDQRDKNYLFGYKCAFDDVDNELKNLVLEEILTEEQLKEIETYMCGDLCMMLFSILDEQTCREEEL